MFHENSIDICLKRRIKPSVTSRSIKTRNSPVEQAHSHLNHHFLRSVSGMAIRLTYIKHRSRHDYYWWFFNWVLTTIKYPMLEVLYIITKQPIY